MGLVLILVMQWFKNWKEDSNPGSALKKKKPCYFRVLYRVKAKAWVTAVVMVQVISKREKQGLGQY